MVSNEFIPIDKETLLAASKNAKTKIDDISKKYNIENSDVIKIIISKCKKLMNSNDAQSKIQYAQYRDIIIGNYSVFLIKLYNQYAKKYNLNANDFIHVPYTNFNAMMKNFDESCGVTFYSFMMMCMQGYMLKYMHENNLVRINPKLKILAKYAELVKTGKDGENIEYLHAPDEYDADASGKLEFMKRICNELPPELKELYGCMELGDTPSDGYNIYAARHSCEYYTVKHMADRMKVMAQKKWKECHADKKVF